MIDKIMMDLKKLAKREKNIEKRIQNVEKIEKELGKRIKLLEKKLNLRKLLKAVKKKTRSPLGHPHRSSADDADESSPRGG